LGIWQIRWENYLPPPTPLGLDNINKLLGILDFIFADCVKTAEKFDMY
jgi:hypothetical protein